MIFTYLRRLGITLLLLYVAYGVWMLATISLRLSRNGAIASQLLESLNQRFPGAVFRGGPSYEREVIYITVQRGLDRALWQEVEQFVRAQKAEKGIAPEIELS